MLQQLHYFGADVKRLVGKQPLRYLLVWLTRQFWGLFAYRFDRGMHLVFGKAYRYIRLPFFPLFTLWQVYSNMEIGYKANIGPGIKVLHPGNGITISELAIIGKNLTMIGGNIIGGNRNCKPGEIKIGDGCYLSANATIIGPIELGNQVIIGANACAVSNFAAGNITLVGVPARPIVRSKPAIRQEPRLPQQDS
ncbi:MAG TPA: hypothetical protein PKD90_10095 [Phnomibacter sp.]|nr:hypothetical protein [Phnomibacter sp.]